MGTHRAIEAAQEQVTAVQQRGIGAQALEDASELDGDVAATDHQYTTRQFFEVERLVGGDRQLLARNIRHLWPAASGDENVSGAVALAFDFDFVGTGDTGMPLQQGHAAVDQQVAVDAVEALDLTVLVGDQGAPVEMPFLQRPAKTGGLLQLVGHMGAIHQQFLARNRR